MADKHGRIHDKTRIMLMKLFITFAFAQLIKQDFDFFKWMPNLKTVFVSADFISFRQELNEEEFLSSKIQTNEIENGNKVANDIKSNLRASYKIDDTNFECDCRNYNYDEKLDYATIAYLITLHNDRTLIDALYLFRALRSPYSLIAIHIDTKLPIYKYHKSPLYEEIENCSCGAKIHVDSIYSCKWGQWSMNEPTIWAMNIFAKDKKFRDVPWTAFINLSADSLPVYTPHQLSQMFASNRGPLYNINFVTSSSCETGLLPTPVSWFPEKWHKRQAYNPEQSFPIIDHNDEDGSPRSTYVETYFGSQWMTLTRSFVSFITNELARNDSLVSQYAHYLQKKRFMVTDETFFASLLMAQYPFNTTQIPQLIEDPKNYENNGSLKQRPGMYAIRYERMDEHFPTVSGYFPNEQRYDVPLSSQQQSSLFEDYDNDFVPVEEPKIWGPYFLGVYDLANIKRSGALFIRKVSVLVEPNLFHMLPVEDVRTLPDIEWVNLNISDVPDWEKVKAGLIKKAKDRMDREEKEREQQRDRELL